MSTESRKRPVPDDEMEDVYEDDDDSDRERIKRKRPNSRKIVDDSKIKGTDNADDAYRLSSFFAKDSSSESVN